MYFYITQPDTVGGVGILPERLQFFPHLFILLWISTLPTDPRLRQIITTFGLGVAFLLLTVRMPFYSGASDAVDEYLSVSTHIPEMSPSSRSVTPTTANTPRPRWPNRRHPPEQ